MIQLIGKLPIPPAVITQRRKAVLSDWVSHGHNEAEIRALVAGPLAIGPERTTVSAPQTKTKRR
jgi:DNA recombination-dependent growth factor C